MKKYVLSCAILFAATFSFGQAKKGHFKSIDESSIPSVGTRYVHPTKYQVLWVNIEQLQNQLAAVKHEDDASYQPVFVELPKADGTYKMYRIAENYTMSKELAAKFPEIRAFDGYATDNSGEVVKLDLTPQGFHAMFLIPGQPSQFIDPYAHLGDNHYAIAYSRADYKTFKAATCGVEGPLTEANAEQEVEIVKSYGDCTRRDYRLALSATGEYTAFQGGTVALAQAAQVTTMNRVNGVYMRDLAVFMTIIGNNNLLIYTNASTDPYTNGDPNSMIDENQSNVTSVIGSANYDIGHVFGTNSGGLAGLGVVCVSSQKASGVTGSAAPVGDAFDIDYVAHEMGHEFGGNHSFRGATGSCQGNANNSTAMEPGSGSTIMAYAGICSPQDIQPHSDDYFHGVNMKEMHQFLVGTGNGCSVNSVIPNQSSPVFTSTTTTALTIPANTPFALTAAATDADGDALTYCWEQMNNESGAGAAQPPVAANTGGPSFRSYNPTTGGTRYFPSIPLLLSNGPFTWEVLPNSNRTMKFRCVVRDNEANGGCNDDADITLTTTTAAGPFLVNYPSASGITWPGNSNQTVTWSVANTDVAPVSCGMVDIIISLDGGSTFTTLLSDTPNDGTEVIAVPNTASTNAIIMVQCANGTFFDVSNNVFAITAATNDYTVSLTPASVSACQGTDAIYTVNIGQIGSYNTSVVLSATGLPSGATATFTPSSVTPAGTSTLTISGTSGVTPGTYSFTVQGDASGNIHTAAATLSVSSGSPVASTLTAPTDGATSVSQPVVFTWTNSGAGLNYDIDIATDAAFTAIVENATALTTQTYTASSLSPSTMYYWRVRSYTSCADGGYSATFSFTTASCATFNASTGLPMTISASGTPTINATMSIPTSGTINSVKVVNLTGTHSYISDLTVTLISPGGTQVVLWDEICDDEDDFNVQFDDASASANSDLPCPPVDGQFYQPNGSLATLIGQQMQGTWTLKIKDHYSSDGGSLTTWGLEICYSDGTPCTLPTSLVISGDNSFCAGGNTTLSVAGQLNDATDWQWYSGSCGGTPVGSGATLTVSTPGNYYVRGEGGCVVSGACQSVAIAQNTVNTSVTNTGGLLTAAQTGASYQWVDCNNGNQPVSGAVGQTFIPSANGSYAVQILTTAGCSATSNCVAYNSLGLADFDMSTVQLYPNPTTGIVTVYFGAQVTLDELTLTDLTGRLIKTDRDLQTNSAEINLTNEAKGVYFLNLRIGQQVQSMKITKQ